MRTVLITGGARGIGAAIAAELTARGCTIVAPSRAEMELADPQSVDRYIADNANLAVDILINNAGINFLKALAELDAATWSSMMQVNVTAPLRLIQAFAPGMQQRKWGRILNVSSIFGIVTKERRMAYSMTKAAINGMTRTAAVELGPDGVLVNSLCPGYVETALTRQNNSPADIAAIEESIPLRRLAQPQELARAVAFLCSEENTYLTGQSVVVDGGFLCK
jgi:3-oxoacyl-[acyl-carrier protein] reductase